MTKYTLATEKQIEEYIKIAENWYTNQNPANMFTSARSCAIRAVVEFLANQDGVTIFNLEK